MAPKFLPVDRIRQIHRDQVERYGGSHGVRDESGLASAVAQAEASFAGEFLHEFPFGMAAAYLFHLVQNHPFVDGNKRVGAMAAFVFLRLNGFVVTATEDDFEALVMATAQGQADKDQIAAFFRQWTESAS